VNQKQVVETPVTSTETVVVQKPRVVMRDQIEQRPRTTYVSDTITETVPVTRPVVTQQASIVNQKSFSMGVTTGKGFGGGKGFNARIAPGFVDNPQVVYTPVVTNTIDYVQVPRTVTTPVTTVESVTVQKPQVVMEDTVEQRSKVTMQKQVVERQVVVKVRASSGLGVGLGCAQKSWLLAVSVRGAHDAGHAPSTHTHYRQKTPPITGACGHHPARQAHHLRARSLHHSQLRQGALLLALCKERGGRHQRHHRQQRHLWHQLCDQPHLQLKGDRDWTRHGDRWPQRR